MPEPPAEGPRAPAMSLVGRLANVFATPGDIFEEVGAAAPCTANWLTPALLLIAVSWVAVWVIFAQEPIRHQLTEKMEQAVEKQVEKGHMSQADADRAREVSTKYGTIGIEVSAAVGPVIAAFLSPFWAGLILWLVGAKVFKGNFPYMKAVEVAGLTNMIVVLDAVVRSLLIIGLGNLSVSPSLVLLVKDVDPQSTSHALLAAVNPMTFWLLAARASGLSKLSGASFAKSALWIFGIWVILVGVGIGLGAGMRALGPH